MPNETSSSDVLSTLDYAPEFTELAARHGPFFFGVFLVLAAIVLVLLNKNRYIWSAFAGFGILFMIAATFLYSGFGNPTYAYTMRLDNLKQNERLILTSSPPRLFRFNRVFDTERESYHVDLITISPKRLEKGHTFSIIIKKTETLQTPNGEERSVAIQYKASIPFNGEADSRYELERDGSDLEEEEGASVYNIVENSIQPAVPSITPFWPDGLISLASAADSYRYGTADTETIEVIYFRKEMDAEKVTSALDALELPYLIKASKLPNPVNAVWIGSDVPSDMVKKLGDTLLQQGVDLKYFGFFNYKDTKTNVIQIGYSGSNAANPSVTQADISNFANELNMQHDVMQTQIQQQEEVNRSLQKEVMTRQKKQLEQRTFSLPKIFK